MYPIALVEWQDAAMTGHWQDGGTPDLPEPNEHTIKTVGFVVHNTDNWLVVVQSSGVDTYANALYIPKGMIRKLETIQHGD